MALTRQFKTGDPAALQRDLIRLCGEIDNALTALRSSFDSQLQAVVSMIPAAEAASYCIANVSFSGSTTEGSVAFSAADITDTDNYHDPAVNNTRFTAPAAGDYEVHVWVGVNTTDADYLSARLRLDGSTTDGMPKMAGSGSGLNSLNGCTLTWSGHLDANQYFELLTDASGAPVTYRAIFLIKRIKLDP